MPGEDARDAQLSAVAALDEPTRRRIYEHVVRQSEPVSRDDVAGALRMARATAAFHLDRLADEGLLDVVHERRSGRSGPGAGRPAKLYHRSGAAISVNLPERRYELAGQLLASAVQEADRTGQSPRGVLDERARELGQQIGRSARDDQGAPSGQDELTRTLEVYGFEPRITGTDVALANCPFHDLARGNADLVCGMNLCLLSGVLEGLELTGYTARLEPAPEHCCVRVALPASPGIPESCHISR